MKFFIDTNVLISYVVETDVNHRQAVKLVNNIKGEKVISDYVILEMACVFSRILPYMEIPKELEEIFKTLKPHEKIYLLIEYTLLQTNVSVECIKEHIESMHLISKELRTKSIIKLGIYYSNELKLKALDLIHLISAKILGCNKFITFDKEILKRKLDIARVLGIEIVP